MNFADLFEQKFITHTPFQKKLSGDANSGNISFQFLYSQWQYRPFVITVSSQSKSKFPLADSGSQKKHRHLGFRKNILKKSLPWTQTPPCPQRGRGWVIVILLFELLIQKLKPKGEHECGLLRKIFSYNSNHLGIFYLQLECMYFLKRLWQAGDEFFVSKLIH